MALIGLFIIWGPQLGWGCKRESSQFQTSRGWHHRVCFSTNVYGLYARGDAETCLSSFHFYLRLRLPYLVKKCRTFKKIYIFRIFDQLCSSFIRTPLSLITPFRLSCCWFVGLHRSNHVTIFVFSIFLLILPSNRLVHSAQFEFEQLKGLVTINHMHHYNTPH